MMTDSAAAILDQEHLDVRLQLLEIAAFFDRLQRAQGELAVDDLRLVRVRMALKFLAEAVDKPQDDRVNQLSLLFSGEDALIASLAAN